MLAVWAFVGICVLCAVLVVAACMRASQTSHRYIVVPPEPKRVVTRYARAWRDELPKADRRTRVER